MNRISIAALATIATLFTACGSSTDTGPQPVTIDFKALVGNQAFSCADTAGYAIGTGTLPWIPKDFRFYVSNVRLVDASGAEAPVTLDSSFWQGYGVALLDFENGTGNCTGGTLEMNTAVRGTANPGTYVGLKFDVGVPTASNHLNYQAANPPLSNSAMYWSWTSGYKFVKIDGLINRADSLHLQLPPGLDRLRARDPGGLLHRLLHDAQRPRRRPSPPSTPAPRRWRSTSRCSSPPPTSTPPTAAEPPAACRVATDPECAPIFSTLGLPFGATPAGTQTAFRVVTK